MTAARRESPDFEKLGMPAYHSRPSAPANLTKYHAVALIGPIARGGVSVFPGDVIAGDGEAVIRIPAHMAQDVAAEDAERRGKPCPFL